MPSYPLLQVDAFTATPLQGNPAAVVLDAAGLADRTMQAIAREMNLSETAFVSPPQSGEADFAARFFTPVREIPLPGHPVIATAQALADTGRWTPAPGRTLRLETRRGVVPVTHRDDAPGPRWIITQPRPEWGRHYAPEVVAPLLGVALEDIAGPPQTVGTGTPQLMILVRSPELLNSLHPDLGGLERLTFEGDFFSIHVFALSGRASGTDVHARHFAPAAGVAEDPVTGSASGAMGAYLVRHRRVRTRALIAEQGAGVGRPGMVFIEVMGEGDEITAVKVGGQAVTVLRGELTL